MDGGIGAAALSREITLTTKDGAIPDSRLVVCFQEGWDDAAREGWSYWDTVDLFLRRKREGKIDGAWTAISKSSSRLLSFS